MSFKNDFKEAVCQRFVAELPDDLKAENDVSYVLPMNSTEGMLGKDEWVQLLIQFSPGRLVALRQKGGHRYERVGHIIVRTHVPVNEGSARGDELTKIIEDMWEGRALTGFVCSFSNVHTRETGKDSTGRYEVLLTDAFFAYRETK